MNPKRTTDQITHDLSFEYDSTLDWAKIVDNFNGLTVLVLSAFEVAELGKAFGKFNHKCRTQRSQTKSAKDRKAYMHSYYMERKIKGLTQKEEPQDAK